MDEKNLIDIEVKLAFHENAIKEQNIIIYRQQKQIDALEKTVKLLKDRMKASDEFSAQQDIPNEKPPHY